MPLLLACNKVKLSRAKAHFIFFVPFTDSHGKGTNYSSKADYYLSEFYHLGLSYTSDNGTRLFQNSIPSFKNHVDPDQLASDSSDPDQLTSDEAS